MSSIDAVHGIKLRGERSDEQEPETQKKTEHQVKIIFEYIIYFNLYSYVNTQRIGGRVLKITVTILGSEDQES